MFQLYPEALDTEVARRREVALLTMRSGRRQWPAERRLTGLATTWHALTLLVALIRKPAG